MQLAPLTSLFLSLLMLMRNLNRLLHLPSPLPCLVSCTDKPPAGPSRFILSLLVNKILRYDGLSSRCSWLTKFPNLRVRSGLSDINLINQLIQQWAGVCFICDSTDSSAETLHYNAPTLHADFKRTRHQEQSGMSTRPCCLQLSVPISATEASYHLLHTLPQSAPACAEGHVMMKPVEPCQLQKSRGTILRLPKQTMRRGATPRVQHPLKMTFDFAPQITHLLVKPGLLCVVCKH